MIFPAALTVIQFFSLWLLLWLPVAIPMALKVGWRPFQPSQPAQKLPLLALLYLLAPLALWLVGCLNLQSLSPKFWGELGIGLLVGAVSLLASFGMQLRIGWLQMDTSLTLKLPDALFLLVMSLWIGWTEELVFRGFMQDQLQQELPIWVAAALISLWFAALHGLWDGREVVPQLPGLWLMGMVLVLARQTADGDLSLAWGLHSGWVWAIGTLDGAMRSSGRHPDWLTGLNDRPLAGFMGLLFLLITAGGLWWVMRLA